MFEVLDPGRVGVLEPGGSGGGLGLARAGGGCQR